MSPKSVRVPPPGSGTVTSEKLGRMSCTNGKNEYVGQARHDDASDHPVGRFVDAVILRRVDVLNEQLRQRRQRVGELLGESLDAERGFLVLGFLVLGKRRRGGDRDERDQDRRQPHRAGDAVPHRDVDGLLDTARRTSR
jgi:hypothetical protein